MFEPVRVLWTYTHTHTCVSWLAHVFESALGITFRLFNCTIGSFRILVVFVGFIGHEHYATQHLQRLLHPQILIVKPEEKL